MASHSAPSQDPHRQDGEIYEVEVIQISPQTQNMVDDKLPYATDDVKQATMALVDAIKKRAKTQAKTTGKWTREAYIEAAKQAKDLLSRRQELAQKYKAQLDDSLEWIEEEANQRWESLSTEAESWGDRLSRAADSAWRILAGTEDHPGDADEPDSASTPPKQCATAQKRALSPYNQVKQAMQDEDDQG